MALNDAQVTILATELTSDPKAMGYSGTSHPDTAILLNAVGGSSEVLPNTSVAVGDVMDAIDIDEVDSISINKLQFFLARAGGEGTLDISAGSAAVGQVLGTFTNALAPNTRGALLLLATRPASRAEILFGAGVTVSPADIAEAR